MTGSAGERHSVVSHPIGRTGTLVLRTVRGSVRVRGSDEDTVRVEARYSLPTEANLEGAELDDIVRVSRTADELRIDADDTTAGVLNTLGKLFGNGRPRIDFDVALPRMAMLRLSGVSANLDVQGLHGELEIRTVSGDISLREVGGQISLQSVSGDASIHGDTMDVKATTTSGDLDIEAERFEAARVRTVSGDVRLEGTFDTGPEHTLESISGDVELAPRNGVSASMTSLSGSIRSEIPHHRDQGRGKRSIVVGDGGARIRFRTMSGDLSIVRASRTPADQPPSPFPDVAGGIGAEQPNQLEILEALERGEIDVEEAARRLEGKENG